MSSRGRNIIVIGTCAGGLEALDTLIGQLPTDLPASIFIVQHMAFENTGGALLHRLSRHRAFRCKLAKDGEFFRSGRIYIAPPDNHLLVKKNKVLVTIAIKKCGGITVVQDPNDAAYPGMLQSALNNLKVDHCVPISEMARLLETLTQERPGKSKPVPKDVRSEAEIAERVLSDVAEVNALGIQVPYNCPNCGGVLWEMDSPDVYKYRCHTGHSFTLSALLESQSEKIEETLWMSLRMFEERKNLLNSTRSKFAVQRAKETQVHIDRIRAILLDPRTWQHTLDRVKRSMSGTPKTKSVRRAEDRLQKENQVSRRAAAVNSKKAR